MKSPFEFYIDKRFTDSKLNRKYNTFPKIYTKLSRQRIQNKTFLRSCASSNLPKTKRQTNSASKKGHPHLLFK